MVQSLNVPNTRAVKIVGEQSTGTETSCLVDSSGHLQVDVLSLTGGSTDDSAAGTTIGLVGGRYDTAPDDVDDGDAVTFQADIKGRLITVDKNEATDDAAAPAAGIMALGKFASMSPDANDAVFIRCGSTGEVVTADLNTATDDAAAKTVGPQVMGVYAAAPASRNDGDAVPLLCDATGKAQVTEASASAIKTAVEKMDDWDGVHGSAAGTDGCMLVAHGKNTAPAAVDADDAVKVWADLSGRVQVQNQHAFAQGSGDYLVANAPCVVHRIILSPTAGGVLTVYNNTSEAAPAALVLTVTGAASAIVVDCGGMYCSTGCYVGKDGAWAGEVTVVYDLV